MLNCFSGLAEQLEVIQAQLSLCEKALAEYLETKRLAFPRFYFASSNDLLDILSNGNQPLKVAKHLTKLFDSMAKLKLREDNPDTANNAQAMVAKDGEIVEFHKDCRCEGQVEVWLNRLLTTMRDSLRYLYTLCCICLGRCCLVLETRVIIKISKNPSYPVNLD